MKREDEGKERMDGRVGSEGKVRSKRLVSVGKEGKGMLA